VRRGRRWGEGRCLTHSRSGGCASLFSFFSTVVTTFFDAVSPIWLLHTHSAHSHSSVGWVQFQTSLVLSVETVLTAAAAAYLAAAGHARLALHVVVVTRISQVMCWLLWWHEQLPLCLVSAGRGFNTSVCVTPKYLATDLSPLEMELCLVGVLHNASMHLLWCCLVLC
jgi:hypothetical protein